MEYDYLIVGAGFAGLTIAERLCTQQNKSVLLVDKRMHIGGNCFDHRDSKTRITTHKYGPHYFRTNSDKVVEYLSQFTKWKKTEYKIASYSDGKLWPFPINLNTYEMFIGRESTEEEFKAYLNENKTLIENPSNAEEAIMSKVGIELYEKFYQGYTIKQWGRNPTELDASVTARVPIRTNRDDRYLSETFQALPKQGYTRMFEEMVKACGNNLTMLLDTDYEDIKDKVTVKHTIYTGPIDKFYEYRYGALPYRSLRFKEETYNVRKFQPFVQVNYPNSEDYTRIVEMKHLTSGIKSKTTIVKEYPQEHTPENEPYYPIPCDQSKELYLRYKELADKEPNVTFIGRLATYKYYNMDQIVALSLQEAERLKELIP